VANDKDFHKNGLLVIPIIGEISWTLANSIFVDSWEYLKENPNTNTIMAIICSNGGDRDAGWCIYRTLLSFGRYVVTVGHTGVNSSAVFPYMAGHKRYAFPETTFLFHPTTILSEKDEERPINVFKEEIISEKISAKRLQEILKSYEVPPKMMRKMSGKESFYLSADKAIECHFVHKIVQYLTDIEEIV